MDLFQDPKVNLPENFIFLAQDGSKLQNFKFWRTHLGNPIVVTQFYYFLLSHGETLSSCLNSLKLYHVMWYLGLQMGTNIPDVYYRSFFESSAFSGLKVNKLQITKQFLKLEKKRCPNCIR